jgi:hypothetical protein
MEQEQADLRGRDHHQRSEGERVGYRIKEKPIGVVLGIKNGSDTRTLRSLTHPAAAQLGIHEITGEGYRCRARTVSRNLYGGAMGRRIKVGCANRRSLSYYTAPNAFAQAVKSEHPSLRQVVHRCGNRFY